MKDEITITNNITGKIIITKRKYTMKKMSVYAAGPITGTSYSEATDWRFRVKESLAPDIDCFSPLRGKSYLMNETSIADSYEDSILSSQRKIFARDSFDCLRCDALFVNLLGAERVSIGTVMEIAWMWGYRKPIVLVMEKDGNLHNHAMIREACPFQVDDLDTGIALMRSLLLP